MSEIKKVIEKIEIKKKSINKKSRHIRWNWEKSPDQEDSNRYHFVIVDDKGRRQKLEKILGNMQGKSIIYSPFNEVRMTEGKVEGSHFRYLFVSYDSSYPPAFVSFEGVSEKTLQDKDLYERKVGNVEDYVADFFS
jgi:hypothetical protein